MSSAKNDISNLVTNGKSFIHIRKSKGPWFDFLGTSHKILDVF